MLSYWDLLWQKKNYLDLGLSKRGMHNTPTRICSKFHPFSSWDLAQNKNRKTQVALIQFERTFWPLESKATKAKVKSIICSIFNEKAPKAYMRDWEWSISFFLLFYLFIQGFLIQLCIFKKMMEIKRLKIRLLQYNYLYIYP